jgi:hypothetical protein
MGSLPGTSIFAFTMLLTAITQSFSQIAFNLLKSLSNETITR